VLVWLLLQAGVELQASHPKHFQYLQLPLYDMPEQDIVTSLPQAFEFIDTAIDGGEGTSSSVQSRVWQQGSITVNTPCQTKSKLFTNGSLALCCCTNCLVVHYTTVVWYNSSLAQADWQLRLRYAC
jgi:hypothetical protein